MFGKSEWFGETGKRKVLRPVERKGWLYYLTWAGIVVLPFLIIMVVSNPLSAFIWLIAASLVFAFDYRKVLTGKQEAEAYDKLFFIGDNAEMSKGETDHYEIQIKD